MTYRHHNWVEKTKKSGHNIEDALLQRSLRQPRIFKEFRFSDAEKLTIDEICGDNHYWDVNTNNAAQCRKLAALARNVSKNSNPTLKKLSHAFKFAGNNEYDYVVLRNTITAPDIATPKTPHLEKDDGVAPIDRLNAIGLACVGAAPVSYQHENDGYPARNVKYDSTAAFEASSQGYLDLGWHQDNCGGLFRHEKTGAKQLPYMPSYLIFGCVHNSEKIPTSITRVHDIIETLKTHDVKALIDLQEDWYEIGAPDSNMDAPRIEGPVLFNSEKGFQMRYDPELVRPKAGLNRSLRKKAQTALSALNAALHIADCYFRRDVSLHPGDFLLFNNYRVVHRRIGFTPSGSARFRWLRRYYGLVNPV